LTIDNLDNVAAGSYQLTVVGDDGTETERRFINLRVYHPNFDNDPMVVSFPSNGATGLTFGQIYLQWDENLNAESYEIEVSDNPSFSTIIGSGAETDTDFSVSGLQDNTVYYWRIKPSNSCVVGEFSQIFSFQTGIEECNDTYDATDFSAATIFDSANNTAFVPININDDLTINRLIVKADITHRSVEDITVFLQEPSQLGSDTIILLDSECDDSDDLFDVTFDDNGTAVVCSPDSPAITGTIAPVQSLGSMSGQSSSGRWLFAVTDNILFDGGSIDAASITVCTTLSNTNLPTFLNNTIDVAANGSYTIQTSDLEASTTSETSDQQIFTVVTLPEKGTIVKNGLALTVGDTFTQQDIDNGLVDYTNTQTSIFDDSFIVDITNAANGWLPNQIIQFSANVVGVDTFQLSNFSVFPNPTEGIVSIRFETQNSDDVYIQLYDLQGRMILKQNYPSDQLRFEESIVFGNVANGIYLLRVSQGNRSVTKNIIISK
jgi:subtilisin-like proprotein convertase family protein